MLPVCSATTTSCSTHSQIYLHGGLRPFLPNQKSFEIKCILDDKVVLGSSNGIHLQGLSFKPQASTSFISNFMDSISHSSLDFVKVMSSYQNGLDDVKCEFSNDLSCSMGVINKPQSMRVGHLKFVENSGVSPGEDELLDFTDRLNENITIDVVQKDPTSASDSLSIGDVFGGINESISDSLSKGENALSNSLDEVTSSITSAFKVANEAVDNALSKVISAVDQTGESTGNRFTGLSNDLKEASSKVGILGIDVLRKTIVSVEDSFARGERFVVYAYGSAKELLPSEFQNVLNSSEERAIQLLRPVGTTFQNVYIALEGLEKSVGLDPNDPIVSFVLLLGTLSALWGCYWVLTYSGYSGDLSPELTLELLTGKESAVLIDVRPEDLRERDGIPDLRRSARFRYANVLLPEVDGSIRNLLRSGRDLDDSLIAVVIRNLNIFEDRSKVIVMDADGSRSKGIARSLKKLGVKKPYLVQGGFRSWTKQGLRVKELKQETTLTILNEEAEAILEDINPTPLKVLGYGVGLIAAAYAFAEWEKTLQLIGVVGLGQTIYRRLTSYEDSEDFKQDVRKLLTPVTLGGQVISWAAGKLETNRVGLPTSPSSSDVQNRVLQAAAKHESQPSDSELTAPENVDLSEA